MSDQAGEAGGGNTTVIESVEFRATAPVTRLPGLENAQQQLDALSAALKRVQTQLAGVSTRTMFKLSAKQYEDVAEKLLQSKGIKGLGVTNIARKLGFGPEAVKDVRATADLLLSEVHKAIGKIEREIKTNPKLRERAIEKRRQQIRQLYAWLPFEGPSGKTFRDAKQAGLFFGGGLLDKDLPLPKGSNLSQAIREVLAKGYAGAALANKEAGEAALRAILQGTTASYGPAPGLVAANLQQAVQQAVKQAAAKAPAVQQAVKQAAGGGSAFAKATADRAAKQPKPGGGAGGGAAKGTMQAPVGIDESGGLVEEKRTTYPGTDTPEKLVRTRRTGLGKTVTTTTQGDSIQQLEWTKVQERLARGFDQQLNALANEYARHLHTFEPATARRVALVQAGAYYKSRPEYAQLGFRDRMAEFVHQLGEKRSAHLQWQLGQEARADSLRRANVFGSSEDEERAALAMADVKENNEIERLQREKAELDRKLQLYQEARGDASRRSVKLSGASEDEERARLAMADVAENERLEKKRQRQEARADADRRSPRTGKSEDEERAALAMADVKENDRLANEKRDLERKANKALERQLRRWEKQAGLDDLDVLEQKRRLKRKQDVEAHEQALQARGARVLKEQVDPLTGRLLTRRYAIESGGHTYVTRLNYDGTGGAFATMTRGASARVPQTRLQNAIEGLSGENMLANLVKVSSWSAAVMVLYKSAELANYSLKRLEQTGMEMAHLDVVFRGVGGTTQELTNDIIKLAAAEGRQTSEAMESAVAWARLGGDRKEINEEVRVSAVASNIANMHMGETTKQLQSLMHIYHLEANDLDSTLSGLVNTTLKYNVTLEEMFTGLDRSAAAAKVAGVSLAELQGMLGVLVGATGQTGATTGNALKYIFQELNKSDVQQQLRSKYGVEALGNNLEQKPAGQILGELSAIWGTRGKRSQQELSGLLGGRFNAARVPVVIQEYPQILKLAIDEQLSLNSAQAANARILDTLKANVAGLKAEYDRLLMSTSLLSKGSFVASFAKNVMHDIASPRENYPWVGWMADHYPFVEKYLPEKPWSGKNLSDRQRNEAYLNGGNGMGRFLSSSLVSLGTLGGMNLPWSPFKTSQPGLFEIFNYAHEAGTEVPGAADFAGRMDELKRRANASALQGQAMEIAQRKLENGSMTQHDANAFAAIMRGMPGGDAAAAGFLNTWQSNKPAAQALVSGLRASAFQKQENIINSRKEQLEKHGASLVRQRDVLEQKGDLTQDEQNRVKELSRQIEQNTEDLKDNTAAWEELQGSVENVQITQQKYLDVLKTQEGLQAGIERSFKMVQAHTPAQELAQDIGALTAQVATAEKEIEDFTARAGGIGKMEPEAGAARARMVEQWKALKAEKAAAEARQPQAEMLTAMQRGVFGAELGERAAGFGYTEADKLLNQRAELTKDIARTEEELAATQGNELQHAELQGRLAKDNMLLYENQLALRSRAADVEREIAQLAIDQNREFARSFFGSGPAEMLRKLAAFRVASQGGVSMGQLFMMSPGMRQDVGQLTGMNPDMMRLLWERGQVQGGLPIRGFAEGGYTGNGNPNEIAGVVHKGEYVLSQEQLSKISAIRKLPGLGGLSDAQILNLGTRASALGQPAGSGVLSHEDLFNLHHGNLYPPGAANRGFLPNGGVYRPMGVPLDDMDALRAANHVITPLRGATPIMPPGSASLGRAPGLWSPWFRRAVGLGSDAWRGATNPANWLGLAKGLGMGVVGGAVTGSLNWLGGKASPSLHGNDTYGGAFLHLGTSALGGAIAGSRGGPLGAGIGAVAGLVGNDVGRIYDELHGAYANTYGAAYTMHQQVDAAQEALLRREPRVGSDFEAAMAARRAAAAKEQQRFETWERGFDARASVASAMDAVVSDRYDRLHARWVAMNHPQTQTHTAQGAHSHGFTRPDWQQRVNRDYGHGAEPRPGMTTVHRMVGQPAGVAHAAGTHVGNVTATATAASYPASPNAPATNDAAVRSAAAAMDQLAASSGRLQAAFESLASRVNSLCQNNGNGSGNGLQFAPGGQQGGWYAGRQP